MKIEDRVVKAMSAGIEKDFVQALDAICPALEATARRKLNKPKVTQSDFKNFLRSYYWLLEPFSGEGINFDDSRFPSLTLETDGKRLIKDPDVADVVYHIYRCALAHGHEITPNYQLVPTQNDGQHNWVIAMDGNTLRCPEALLWGLIALVVFCEPNRNLATNTGLYLTWGGGPRPKYIFHLDLFWGAEETVCRFFGKLERIRVTLNL